MPKFWMDDRLSHLKLSDDFGMQILLEIIHIW